MSELPKVIVGDNLVVATGSVLLPNSEEFDITPVPSTATPLRIKIRFETKEDTDKSFSFTMQDFTLNCVATNFDNSLGTAFVEPWEIGWIGTQRRRLFLMLAVHTIGSGPKFARVVNYSITAEGTQDV